MPMHDQAAHKRLHTTSEDSQMMVKAFRKRVLGGPDQPGSEDSLIQLCSCGRSRTLWSGRGRSRQVERHILSSQAPSREIATRASLLIDHASSGRHSDSRAPAHHCTQFRYVNKQHKKFLCGPFAF